MDSLQIGSVVVMRKKHPCGTSTFIIEKFGADVKIKCLSCGRVILLPRMEFRKKIKEVVK